MKNRNIIIGIVLSAFALFVYQSCEKDDLNPDEDQNNENADSVELTGTIYKPGDFMMDTLYPQMQLNFEDDTLYLGGTFKSTTAPVETKYIFHKTQENPGKTSVLYMNNMLPAYYYQVNTKTGTKDSLLTCFDVIKENSFVINIYTRDWVNDTNTSLINTIKIYKNGSDFSYKYLDTIPESNNYSIDKSGISDYETLYMTNTSNIVIEGLSWLSNQNDPGLILSGNTKSLKSLNVDPLTIVAGCALLGAVMYTGLKTIQKKGIKNITNEEANDVKSLFEWAVNQALPNADAAALPEPESFTADADNDGIPNARDNCANTPQNAVVDAWGCVKEIVDLNAAFSADQTSINEGSTVQFSDESTNNPTSWSWDFGDGSTSTQQNPSHTYNSEGYYTVELTITNSAGSDTETKIDYITVNSGGGNCPSSVTDYDGNTYNTVQIGNQCWMKENLKTTHYSDGTAIPHVTGDSEWDDLTETEKAWCYYDNSSVNGNTYGALYTWAAAMNGAAGSNSNPSGVQGVCPDGWHLPSDDEWVELEDYLIANGYNWDGSTSGNKIGKSMASTSDWNSSLEEGDVGNDQLSNNSTGFTALPGGYRRGHNDAGFYANGLYGKWWSSRGESSASAYYRYLSYKYSSLVRSSHSNKESGFSVRCVRDD